MPTGPFVTDNDMPANLLQIVESTTLDVDMISARTARIHSVVLSKSDYIDNPNFTCIHPADLELLFAEYDTEFFDGQIKQTLGSIPLRFGLSKRMTSSGGKTTCYADRASNRRRYEIKVSTTILFGCFDGSDHRPISCSGILCRDRVDALQRVMEHELVHLIEMLLWDKSSCSHARFHSITRRFFSHTENKHQLITPREKAMVQYGILPGMKVRFPFDGVQHQGVVNRINKRATVLVEDRRGERYSDGKTYAKFYVPVQLLEAME
jgi:predicted metal-binding protein